ncbi:MAG TPA: O-antigen ligase family protein [Bryobacteraceae bacterium]|nr:O-antigen ligase family protein [Bryobacteraceae bacterium]
MAKTKRASNCEGGGSVIYKLLPPPFLKKLALWLAGASAVAILLSIAVSQILLALALSAVLLSGLPLRWPRVTIPLAFFLGWTLVALAFSPDPHFGLPTVRKMLVVYPMLLIVYSSVRTLGEARWLIFTWIGVGSITAARGLFQYAADVAGARAAHEIFYNYYIADRIRGFMSHWMTFSGEELFVLLLAAAFLFFAPDVRKWRWVAAVCACVIGLALILSDTRSIWLAALAAGVYLLWEWRKWSVLAVPVLLILGFFAAPAAVKQRVRSLTDPHGQLDSNSHRKIVWLVGLQMIKAHPVFGVGPEEIRKKEVFDAYLPAYIHYPLPDGNYQHLHSIYIHYAAEDGLPAAIFLTAALLLAIVDFRRALRTVPAGRSNRRFVLEAAIACVIGTMVSGIAEKNLGDTEVLTMFLSILCVGYLAVNSEKAFPAKQTRVSG